MADQIGLEHQLYELHLLARNSLARMKIIFSLWRKIRELAKVGMLEKVGASAQDRYGERCPTISEHEGATGF